MTQLFSICFKSCGWSTMSADNLKSIWKTKTDFSQPFRLVQVMAEEPFGLYIYTERCVRNPQTEGQRKSIRFLQCLQLLEPPLFKLLVSFMILLPL